MPHTTLQCEMPTPPMHLMTLVKYKPAQVREKRSLFRLGIWDGFSTNP